eukprot:m.299751 g.299751  ORF g.299751 m.299751 type:complete len:126 (+) comp20119_c0_seq14:1186-1563(+)
MNNILNIVDGMQPPASTSVFPTEQPAAIVAMLIGYLVEQTNRDTWASLTSSCSNFAERSSAISWKSSYSSTCSGYFSCNCPVGSSSGESLKPTVCNAATVVYVFAIAVVLCRCACVQAWNVWVGF